MEAAPRRADRVADAAVRLGLMTAVLAVVPELWAAASTRGMGRVQTLILVAGAGVTLGGTLLELVTNGSRLRTRLAAFLRFLPIAAQLALVYLAIRAFAIHSPTFHERVVPLALLGFVIHHLLPDRYRVAFFVALSLSGIALVFGPVDGAWLVGIGVVLIGISRLPLAMRLRVGLLLVTAGALALARVNVVAAPWSTGIWPILGAMFMFRLIIYLYDLAHAERRPSFTESLAYFFMLPNVAFPLFPVIDSSTFLRTRYDDEALRIYQRGIRWMLLGVGHLLVYRLTYQRLTLLPTEVGSLPDLLRYVVTNFMLYFRVAGIFHLVVGLLHLFGFHLPPTYKWFPLAHSFTDLWRRNNIYWKDFMQKVVHFPIFFRARRWGETRALVVATVGVVAATWLLHSYQWLWILGRPLFAVTDVLFWGVLGVGMVVAALREMKRGRVRTLRKPPPWSLRASGARAVRTVGFFLLFTTLWSLWSSPTLGDWLGMVGGIEVTAGGVGVVLGLAIAAVATFVVVHRLLTLWPGVRASLPERWVSRGPVVATAACAALLAVLGHPAMAGAGGVATQRLLRDIKLTELNRGDRARLQRGYYENIAGVDRFDSPLWELYAQRPADWPVIGETPLARLREDLLELELRPLQALYFHGRPFRTNRWGMRDSDYDSLPAPGVHRIALLGASYTMGSGVADAETFEQRLEARLNDRQAAAGAPPVEILNFAVGGYTPAHQLMILEDRVLPFAPRHIFLIAHHRDAEFIMISLVRVLRAGGTIPLDYLREVLHETGVDSTLPTVAALRRLEPRQDAVLRETYARLAAGIRAGGARPVWIYLAMPGAEAEDSVVARLAGWAHAAGFDTLSLGGIYEGHGIDSLRVASWDWHPNAAGHELIAGALLERLVARRETLGLPLVPAAGGR